MSKVESYNTPEHLNFQICSDVHLEEHPERSFDDVIIARAPYLILAGDIGDPSTSEFTEFLNKCSSSFEHVYFVPGNHEYHGHGIYEGDRLLKSVIGKLANVTLLQCNKATIGPYVIVGATLWTNIPAHLHQAAVQNVGDYSKMDKDFTPAQCSRINRNQVTWLSGIIREAHANGKHLIVVTHHPPSMSGTSHPSFSSDPLRFCYRNNLDHLVSLPGNIVWVSGHTHFSYMHRRGKAWLVSNQVNSKNHNKSKVFKIDTNTNLLLE